MIKIIARAKWISFLFVVFLAFFAQSCASKNTQDSGTALMQSSIPHTRHPSPTSTPTPNPTLAYYETNLEPSLKTTLGSGTLSGISRSPNKEIVAYCEGGFLYLHDGDSFEEIGIVEIREDWVSRIEFSSDSKLVIVYGFLGASIVDLETQEVVDRFGGGQGGVSCVQFTPDDKLAVYFANDHTTGGPYQYIGVRDIQNGDTVHYLPVLYPDRYHRVTCPALSSDGTWVAAGYEDYTEKILYIWDVQTGEIRFAIEAHGSRVTSVDVSPDGKYLASGSSDGTVRLWDPNTGKLFRVITGFQDDVEWVQFSSDGRLIHVEVNNQPDQVFDMLTGQMHPAEIEVPTSDPFTHFMHLRGYSTDSGSSVQALFSPDGRTVAYGTSHILLWDIATERLINSLEADRTQMILGMAFSPDGRQIAAIYRWGDVVVWDISTGEIVLTLTGDADGTYQVLYAISDANLGPGIGGGAAGGIGIAFSPDGKSIAFGNGLDIEVWDVENSERVMPYERTSDHSFVTRLSFSEDGSKLYAVLDRNRGAGIWDTQTGKLIRQLELPSVDMNAFTATDLNGHMFARNNYDYELGEYWIEIWNLETREVMKLNMTSRENEPMRFSPDGELLVVKSEDILYFWKVTTGELVYMMDEQTGLPGMAISPDSQTLAIGYEGFLELWDVDLLASFAQSADFYPASHPPTPTPYYYWSTETPQPTRMITPMELPEVSTKALSPNNAVEIEETASFGKGTIEDAVWSNDSKQIIVTGSEGVFQYNSITMKEISHFECDNWFEHVILTPNQKILATGNFKDQVQVWDVDEVELLFTEEGWGESAVSPNGKSVVFLNDEANLQLWDIETDQPATVLHSYSAYSQSPVFSPDGRFVAAIQTDYSVRIWDANTGEIYNAVGGPDNPISTMSFSADGQYIIAAAAGSAWIWNIQPGSPTYSVDLYEGVIDGNLTLYDDMVTAAALSPDNRILAVGTTEGDILLYDRVSRGLLRTLVGHASPIDLLRFSPGGGRLLSVDTDGVMIVWDVAGGQQLVMNDDHLGGLEGLLFNRDDNLAAWGRNTNWVVRPTNGEVVERTSIDSGKILAVSPLGDWIAVYAPYQVSLWTTGDAIKELTLEGEAPDLHVDYFFEFSTLRQFYDASFSADGSRLATYGMGGIWVYNSSNGQLLQQIGGSNARQGDFSPNNRWIVTSTFYQANPLTIYDIQTGNSDISFDRRGSDYPQFVYSPDGLWVVAVRYDWEDETSALVFHSVSSGLVERSLPFTNYSDALSLALSPDAQLVAVGLEEGKILLIDVESFKIVLELEGHKGAVEHLAFSNDGIYLASGGTDGVVRLWGVPSCQ